MVERDARKLERRRHRNEGSQSPRSGRTMIEIISIVSAVIGILIFAFYCINWFAYSPRLFIRFGGADGFVNPVAVGRNGRIPFAVSVKSAKHCRILSTTVEFDPREVDLRAPGATDQLTADRSLPMAVAVRFTGPPAVTRGVLAAHYFDYSSKAQGFSLRFIVTVKLDDTEIPFPLSMFPARTERLEQTVQFQVIKGTVMDIRHFGLLLKPGESLQGGGSQHSTGEERITQ